MKYGYTVWCFCIFVGCSANGNSNNTETNNSSNNTNNLTNLNNANNQNNQNNANNVNNVNNANNLNNANNVNNTNNTNQTNNTNNTNNTNQTNNINNGCVDCDPNTSDLFCEYTDIPANPPEVGYRMGLTAAHNEWRWRVGTTPLNWNNTLAVSADSWAINCQFQHDPDRAPDAGFNSIGENIYLVGGGLTPTKVLNAVSAWASERTLYDYGTAIDLQNYMIFGHYTQIVWDDTTDVGCGARFCAGLNATMVVCRYGPAGNFIGQTPYDFGADACYDLDNDDTWQGDDADDTDRTVQ